MNLFLTADRIGVETGGGRVTAEELKALQSLGNTTVLQPDSNIHEPFAQDEDALYKVTHYPRSFKLAHAYSGCLSKTYRHLKVNKGVKLTYTVAAHDKEASRKEHEKLGWAFPYPHLIQPDLWEKYIEGYYQADVIITPSQHGKDCIHNYGEKWADKRVEIIPHGVDIPEGPPAPLPYLFSVGYMGAIGADKGLIYLLRAWKKLGYKDAQLVIAGKDSIHPMVHNWVTREGGGAVTLLGWVKEIKDFFSQISLYVQPSCTEGYGIEVLESMAHGRPVLCSRGAGARDVVPPDGGATFDPCNSDYLAECIDMAKKKWDLQEMGRVAREEAKKYEWSLIREKYVALWKELLG